MALTLGDNFSYQGAKPLDARLKYDTLANMKAVADATMYDGCMAYCVATDKTYQWKFSNTVDADTGKWREFSSGGGGGTSDYSDLTNKPSIEGVTLSGNKTASDLGLAKSTDIPSTSDCYKTGDTAFTAIADADYVPVYDSSETTKKKSLWSNVKSVLKTYFDTLYSTTKTRGTPASGGTALSLVNTGDMYNWNTDSVIYCTCATTAATTAKVATVSRGTFTLVAGAKVCVKFTYANTAEAPTLNVSSKGAKNIKYIGTDGTVETPNIWWGAGDVVTFIYDGTQFLMQPTYGMPSMPVLGTIDRSDIYDTTEKVVGKWTDGRPIYQKSFTGSLTGTSTVGAEVATEVAMGVNISAYIDVECWAYNSQNKVYQKFNLCVPANSNSTLRMTCNANGHASKPNKVILANAFMLSTDSPLYYLTVRYTKTTDAANSYNYASENDYSTTEKIVGTWIDGKPLYQKTLQTTIPTCTTDGTTVTSAVPTGTTFDKVISIVGTMYHNGKWISLPSIQSSSTNAFLGNIRFTATPETNIITILNSASGWSGNTAYITFQYTKTT